MENKNISRLTLDLPTELHLRLKLASVKQGVSMKSLIMQWIEQELAALESKGTE